MLSVGYRVNSVNATAFRRWSNTILKQYLLQGYSINRHLVALQERTDQRFVDIEQSLNNPQKQIDLFIRTNVPPIEGIFYEGHVLDARLFAEQLIKIAKREIVLIDNYIDSRSFDILELRNPGVEATIYV
ncbi:MAG: RhuM family protein, partial [Bacteroidales bacterium]|nr:RhuM family protein [Bacteroidales bacterium]